MRQELADAKFRYDYALKAARGLTDIRRAERDWAEAQRADRQLDLADVVRNTLLAQDVWSMLRAGGGYDWDELSAYNTDIHAAYAEGNFDLARQLEEEKLCLRS